MCNWSEEDQDRKCFLVKSYESLQKALGMVNVEKRKLQANYKHVQYAHMKWAVGFYSGASKPH